MPDFKQNLRKRFEEKIEKPLKRFPLKNGSHDLAQDALNHARANLGLRADVQVRPGGSDGQYLSKKILSSPDSIRLLRSGPVPELMTVIGWSRIRLMLREPFLEFWGAFIMVLLGNSVSAQTYLSNQQYGTWVNICLG